MKINDGRQFFCRTHFHNSLPAPHVHIAGLFLWVRPLHAKGSGRFSRAGARLSNIPSHASLSRIISLNWENLTDRKEALAFLRDIRGAWLMAKTSTGCLCIGPPSALGAS